MVRRTQAAGSRESGPISWVASAIFHFYASGRRVGVRRTTVVHTCLAEERRGAEEAWPSRRP
eukprot:3937291-Rhodomonas_salina.1